MSLVYYKATRPDGTDFRTGTVLYEVGKRTTHPAAKRTRNDPSTYLSVATVPTDCTGMRWPCRLFAVHGVGRPLTADNLPNKRCFSAVDVVEELPAWQALGPQGEEVAAFIGRAGRLTPDEAWRLGAAWGVAWGVAWDAARDATWTAARDAARDAARGAAGDAAWNAARSVARGAAGYAAVALVVRDLISTEHFDTLYGPWREVIG